MALSRGNFLGLTSVAVCVWMLCGCSGGMKPVHLTAEYDECPLALATAQPRLGWQVATRAQDWRQSAYEIKVCDKEGAVCWQSGRVESDQSQLVPYGGEALQPLGAYCWKVRVWDDKGRASAWSRPAFFRLAPDNSWLEQACWIGAITRSDSRLPEGRGYEGNTVNRNQAMKTAWAQTDTLSRKSILLRRDFEVKKGLREAVVYISGLGHYELTINGKKIGGEEFAPLWSDYDKTVYYNVYDVTSALKSRNAIGVMLGNGFFNVQGGRYRKLLVSFGPPTLLLRLHLSYEDGTQEDICSDARWRYDFSPVSFNCIYGGEDYDATREQPGWDCYGYEAAGWRPVVVQEAPKGQLRPQTAPGVRIAERYGIRSYWYKTLQAERRRGQPAEPGRQVCVLDMGQNLAGFPQFTVRGKRGDRFRLVVGESLGRDSVVNQSQSGSPHYYEYTLKGRGAETWHPRFSYYGFRYIRLEGAVLKGEPNPDGLPVIEKIESCFIYNSAAVNGHFASSNDIFNDVHRLIQMAVRSNMQAVFTDCPQREKLGWLEQVHLNGAQLLYNYDLSRLWPKVMQDMADAQYADGLVPTTAPMYTEFGRTWNDSPEWGSSSVIVPYMYYQFFGDTEPLRRYYGMMRAYVDYLENSSDNHIVMQGLGDWYDFGPNRPGFAQNTPVPFVGTAHLYYDIQLLVKTARLLGYQNDVEKYTALGQAVCEAFHEKYFRADSSIYATGSQASYALPLFLDMVPDGHREKVMQHLIDDVVAHGNRLTTGEVGNRYLFSVLADNGQNELMYKMHNHEEVPGYGFQRKFGATTLTEQWDPRQGASWNHFMLGAIDEWFFSSLGGIRLDPEQPGGRHLIICPQVLGDMTWVDCSTATLYGPVAVKWKLVGDGVFDMTLDLPANTSARVQLPGGGEAFEVGSGRHHWQTNIGK